MFIKDDLEKAFDYIYVEYQTWFDNYKINLLKSKELNDYLESLDKDPIVLKLHSISHFDNFLQELQTMFDDCDSNNVNSYSLSLIEVNKYIHNYKALMLDKFTNYKLFDLSYIKALIFKEQENYGTLNSLCEGVLELLKSKHAKGK